jgi:hypothetical protein
MDRQQYKIRVLAAARARQQELIDDFRKRINDMRQSEMTVHEDEFDDEDRSYTAAASDLVNSLSKELEFLLEEMAFLNRMKADELHDAVTIGSVVRTNKRTFFPSVSIEEFKVNGDQLFGISTKAPLYMEMVGKKAGETFRFNDHEYTVLELF